MDNFFVLLIIKKMVNFLKLFFFISFILRNLQNL